MNTYLFIQGFLLGMAAMLAICVFPRVMADIKEQKDGEPEERVYCKQCIYFDRNYLSDFGLCRLNAPIPCGGKVDSARWQGVEIIDWCGEGVKREEECQNQ